MIPASDIIRTEAPSDDARPDILQTCIKGKEVCGALIALQRDIYHLRRQMPTVDGPVGKITRGKLESSIRDKLQKFNELAAQLQSIAQAVAEFSEGEA